MKYTKYLGIGIVLSLLVYLLVCKCFSVYVEGMSNSNKEQIPNEIKTNTENKDDELRYNTYRDAYEDTIVELDKNISSAVLYGVLKNAKEISDDPYSKESQSIVTKINNLVTFKNVLNDKKNSPITILDGK